MLNFGLQLTLLLTIGLFGFALIPIRRIQTMLPNGRLRKIWCGVAALNLVSVLGTVAFLVVNASEGSDHKEDLLVMLILFSGSLFSLTISHLSYLTALDASRIASLELAATIDPVTNLLNRRQIVALLESECMESQRRQRSLSILILDIDNFKRVNDTYGHAAGDVILRTLGRLIADTVPLMSSVGRFGGEEFLVILPGTTSAEANITAQKVRGLVEAMTVTHGDQAVASPTVSIGVATTFGWKECSDELIAIADEALYAAKLAGRNRVVHGFERVDKNRLAPLKIKISPAWTNAPDSAERLV